MTDDRLQQRGGELERQRDQPDLGKVERVSHLQDRIHRCDQRLHRVVEEMREADADEDDVGRPRRAWLGRRGASLDDDRLGESFLADNNGLVHESSWRRGRRAMRSSYAGRASSTTANRKWLRCKGQLEFRDQDAADRATINGPCPGCGAACKRCSVEPGPSKNQWAPDLQRATTKTTCCAASGELPNWLVVTPPPARVPKRCDRPLPRPARDRRPHPSHGSQARCRTNAPAGGPGR